MHILGVANISTSSSHPRHAAQQFSPSLPPFLVEMTSTILEHIFQINKYIKSYLLSLHIQIIDFECFNRELIKNTFKLFFSVYKFPCSGYRYPETTTMRHMPLVGTQQTLQVHHSAVKIAKNLRYFELKGKTPEVFQSSVLFFPHHTENPSPSANGCVWQPVCILQQAPQSSCQHCSKLIQLGVI